MDAGANVDAINTKFDELASKYDSTIVRGSSESKPPVYGRTPLQLAVSGGRLKVAEYLLMQGADVNKPTFQAADRADKEEIPPGLFPDLRGGPISPLHLAISSRMLSENETKMLKMAKLLIKYGAKVNAVCKLPAQLYAPASNSKQQAKEFTPYELALHLGFSRVANYLNSL
ncbi:hypothetical protein [Anaerohalosphaera lusitana]|uniref:hypothetical protein n=1 Tax=Anaerohalosphaera lusitana TaxID=1936003 RepID=UPI00197BA175|nr:hypothetical protein [Anaerohalosphaera lusitana]